MCDINCVQKLQISDKTEMNEELHYLTLKRPIHILFFYFNKASNPFLSHFFHIYLC